MELNVLILFILLSSIASYILTKVNKKVGAFYVILVSLISVFSVYVLKDSSTSLYEIAKIGNINLELITSNYAWFFAITVLTVFASVSFFIPYWLEKLVHPAAFNMLFLLSMAGTLGVFFSKDFLTLFIFWEIAVWASVFVIGFGKSLKAPSIYYGVSTLGSFMMLYAIFLAYAKYNTFEINGVINGLSNDPKFAILFFFLFVVAGLAEFGIFPFHVLAPISQGNAPDIFSAVLAGAVEKMGAFVAFIVTVLLPSLKVFSTDLKIMGYPFENYVLMILGAISIIVGTLMAIKQDDVKRLIAYSSVSNAGYILVGLATMNQYGFAGGMMHIFNHAIASAAMFLAFAGIAYRTGTTKISELGGLIFKMPLTYAAYLLAIISVAGIPPLSGFASKWIIFQTLVRGGNVFIAFAAFFGSVGSFLYVFRPLAGALLGQLSPKYKDVKEVPVLMQIPLIVLSLLSLLYGVYPGLMLRFIGKIETSLNIKPIVIDGFKIITPNGQWDSFIVTLVFAGGFIAALILFALLPKSKKVGLMDTYTSSEFIYDPDKYHYSQNFYAPFERMYKNHPSFERLYDAIAMRVEELGMLVKTWFFNDNPAYTVFWISVVITVIFMWGDKI
ncbi:proton-conducting transporter membrane subunit [Marinitoga litoralis]|uniref:proton-conducting transporter transmembrane domain-containing protein n=1 Tax=Marinitoga litoralis TaxID=570855 RepID=UPI0019609A3B|nr:proton-conducting transporter membrane subunit [Marinitoga litoralis]MBM7558435.1 NADH-quinone oxidoreductase subunit M [Marinitoga litoralis]